MGGDTLTLIWDDLPLDNPAARQCLEKSIQNNRHGGKFINNIVLTQSVEPLIKGRFPQLQAGLNGIFFSYKDAGTYCNHSKKLSSLLGHDQPKLLEQFENIRGISRQQGFMYVGKNLPDHFVHVGFENDSFHKEDPVNLVELLAQPNEKKGDESKWDGESSASEGEDD